MNFLKPSDKMKSSLTGGGQLSRDDLLISCDKLFVLQYIGLILSG